MATQMPSSLEIAQEATLRPIAEIAEELGLEPDEYDLYGKYKAKVDLVRRRAARATGPTAKLICVTAITPTKAGEGKTTTSVSLTQGLGHIGRRAALCLREASLGPVFGIKGGAAGGGYAQVVPMEDLNLHFTGDIHAIGAANNLLAAMLEAHLLHGNKLGIDPLTVSWRRCVDINDRALRQITIGLGGRANGYPRETGFDITAASEVMAIVAVAARPARPAQAARRDHRRLHLGGRARRRRAAAGGRRDDRAPQGRDQAEPRPDARGPAGVRPLRARSRTSPTATTRSSPTSSALKLGDYVVTESGFGSDMGMEKFLDIVCRIGGLRPSAVVLVATVRALKHHGGDPDGGLEAIERGADEPAPPPRHRRGVRAQGRRRRQPLPDRHRRGARGRAPARARATARTPPS